MIFNLKMKIIIIIRHNQLKLKNKTYNLFIISKHLNNALIKMMKKKLQKHYQLNLKKLN